MLLKLIVHLSRIFVGAMFIFSGFVKLVDPIGSQYKFEEYFSEGVLNLEFLIPLILNSSLAASTTRSILSFLSRLNSFK